jgi:cation:H+ antiporter
MQLVLVAFHLAIFVIGLALLIYGSEYFVESASRIAKGVGVSELFIGLTIVAVGTSLPEIVSSSASVIAGKSALAFSNILGSFIANISLIVGFSALVAPIAANAIVIERDAKIMILTAAVLAAFVFDPFTPGVIVFWEAIVLLILFVAYVSFLYHGREECETCYQFYFFVEYLIRLRFMTTLRGLRGRSKVDQKQEARRETDEEAEGGTTNRGVLHRDIALVIVAAAFIALGSQLVVAGADFITTAWGIQEGVVGVSLLAIGTSLPELTVSLNSVKKGFGRLLIGNVIGSNIVNVTLGLGVVALLTPAVVGTGLGAIALVVFSVGIALLFYGIIRTRWRVTRTTGLVLLLIFAISQASIVAVTQIFG